MEAPSTHPLPLSIIIPVYNKAAYVGKCLQSILDQDYCDYELIIINDGSTDGSVEIIEQFSDPRITLLTTINQGVSAARNRGITEAKGHYLMFVDADDYLSPHYLHHVMEQCKDHEADLYVWGITKDYANGRMVQKIPHPKGLLRTGDFLHEMIEEQYRRHEGIMGYIPNKLIKRDLVINHHIRFDTHKRLMEDYDFYLSYYAHVQTAYFFDESGYHYVDHPSTADAPSRRVDYLSLIDTHRRCMLLTPLSSEPGSDYRLILQAIGKLTLAMFLELKPVTMGSTKQLLTSMGQRPFCAYGLRMTNPKQRNLRKMALANSPFGVYAYLKFRDLYFKLKRGGSPS